MKLRQLLENIDYSLESGTLGTDITDITLNSKEVKDNSLFVCIKGAERDGHDYIDQAVENGARALLVEELPEGSYPEVAIIKVEDSEEVLSQIAANYYDHPADKLTTIGITGTKGKTTVCKMIEHVINKTGSKCGSIGSLGVFYDDVHYKTINTTPDSITTQRILDEIVRNGCQYVVMEVSSQAFKRKRTRGIEFDIGIFLNIDRDHIGEGEHADFEEYLNCKRQIFKESVKKIINNAPEYQKLLSPSDKDGAITFSATHDADYKAEGISPIKIKGHYGSDFNLEGKPEQSVRLTIPGIFNVENALVALAVSDILDLDFSKTVESLKDFQISGRSEIIEKALDYGKTIFIDFAHNKLSFKSVLEGMRAYNPKRLICLFGLESDETRMRRYDEGYYAGKYSDYAILTSHNRHDESFESVNEDIIRGLEDAGHPYTIIKDREEAIKYAIDIAEPDDIILLAGMGSYRTLNQDGNVVDFSEIQIVEDYLKEKEISTNKKSKS